MIIFFLIDTLFIRISTQKVYVKTLCQETTWHTTVKASTSNKILIIQKLMMNWIKVDFTQSQFNVCEAFKFLLLEEKIMCCNRHIYV